ncbi:MAG: 2-hydroxyacyl-CoA dehydratase family protein [Dehalococcoidia bacterium]|nr:2-hydroxyacyl-CoA dehydratase family protein [Dehalococcoidia bacterium]
MTGHERGIVAGQLEGGLGDICRLADPPDQAFDYPHLKDRMERAGIPHLFMESGHEGLTLGQIRTRVQAFLEQITGI